MTNHDGIGHVLFGNYEVDDLDDTIPQAFIDGTSTIAEARRRWQNTKKWRSQHKIDSILTEPQKHYFEIKKNHVHGYHGTTTEKMHLYIERPGHSKISDILKSGVTMEDIELHYAFRTEYLLRVEANDDEKTLSIFDIDNIGIRHLAGDNLALLRRINSVIGLNYPERAGKIFVINAPYWAAAFWQIVKPILDPVTQKKISVIPSGTDHIQRISEYAPSELLPPEIGGTSPYKIGDHPVEMRIATLVNKYLDQ